jgi:hypothetical protein
MDALSDTIDVAIQSNDYAALEIVFSFGPNSWQSVGQGEQRSLAAHFVKSAVASGRFLPNAFQSAQMMHIMLEALGHLPSTVDGAADNALRQMIFDFKVNQESDYSAAARVLGGMRMEDDQASVYYTSPAAKCDGMYESRCKVYCYLGWMQCWFLNCLASGSYYSLRKDCRMFSRRR